jgi:hypothetical protein
LKECRCLSGGAAWAHTAQQGTAPRHMARQQLLVTLLQAQSCSSSKQQDKKHDTMRYLTVGR